MNTSIFIADGTTVYGFNPNGTRVAIATSESETWAQTIAELLTGDPDAYVVGG